MNSSCSRSLRSAPTIRWLSVTTVLCISAAIAACYSGSYYAPVTELSASPVSVYLERTLSGLLLRVTARQPVRVGCASSRLVGTNNFSVRPMKDLATDCMDDQRDLTVDESLDLRFQLDSVPISQTADEEKHLAGKPKKIALQLMIKNAGTWETLSYPYEIKNRYVIPFAKG